MAIYHASLKTFSRALGHSSVAAAAYRVGASFTDERTGVRHDYSIRSGVASSQVLLPPGAPSCFRSVPHLWNAAEAAEKRVNSCVARELIVALPAELDEGQRLALALQLGQMLVDRYQVGLTLAVHAPSVKGDDRNHHVHLLFSTRTLGVDGFGAKTRVLDDKSTGPAEVSAIREAVAKLTNEALGLAGSAVRVDHRSLEAQADEAAERGDLEAVTRLARPATKPEGKAATAAKRRGHRMDRVLANDAVREAARDVRARWELLSPPATSPTVPRVRRPLPMHSDIFAEGPTCPRTPRENRAHPPRSNLAGPVRVPRLPRPGATASALYLHQLREAEREASTIAEAYIRILQLQGHEARAVMLRAQQDAAFALLLQKTSFAWKASMSQALPSEPLSRAGRRHVPSSRTRGARWRAFERARRRAMPLASDAGRSVELRESVSRGNRARQAPLRAGPRLR